MNGVHASGLNKSSIQNVVRPIERNIIYVEISRAFSNLTLLKLSYLSRFGGTQKPRECVCKDGYVSPRAVQMGETTWKREGRGRGGLWFWLASLTSNHKEWFFQSSPFAVIWRVNVETIDCGVDPGFSAGSPSPEQLPSSGAQFHKRWGWSSSFIVPLAGGKSFPFQAGIFNT